MARRILVTSGFSALTAGVSTLAGVVGFALPGCALPVDTPVFDPRLLQRSERAAAPLDRSEPQRPLPTTQEDPLGGAGSTRAGTTRPASPPTTGPAFGSSGEPILPITLQQAVQRAVVYNHEVKVAGFQPSIDSARVVEAQANFDPVFFSQVQFQKKDNMTAGEVFFDPSNTTNFRNTISFFDKQDIYTGQIGIRQKLESGGEVEARFDTTYNELIPKRFVDNPFYENRLTLQVTQPLLRNFGSDVNQARIVINRDTARISLLDFRKAVEENVAKVEETYWQLVNAQRNVAVEESLLRENEASYRVQYGRLGTNLVSSLEVSQVQSELEARRAALIRARADARNLSDQLKQLMNDPNLPVAAPVLLVAADGPVEAPLRLNIDEEIASGLENRFELGEQLLKIDQATVTVGVAKNNTLPKLDAVGSVSPQVIGPDFRQTLSKEAKFGHFDYTIGLQFEFPIGNREALSILRRTELQREQSIEQYSALISQVALEVRQSAREVETTYDLIVVTRQSRLAAQRALSDIVQRLDKGALPQDPSNVQLRLDLADRVARGQETENQAVTNYNIALEKLERAKGTLLRYNNVVMQEEPYRNQGMLR